MYDAGKIVPGLVLFVALITSPFLFSQGVAAHKADPKIDTPAIKEMAEKKRCVEPKAFMKSSHMQLLNEWRDRALRDGNRTYVASDGRKYNISLQNTCLKCHSNPKKFCNECHNYVSVRPYCWDCHIEPKEKAI
ncbi:MAG: sulfate reduction electron transfer complex DsrMKJOP subunit DsrJ [Pseudomonadota bacterium]